jgi:hypothetical protein
MNLEQLAAWISMGIAFIALLFSYRTQKKVDFMEQISRLLGEKEEVAHVSLKYLQGTPLPNDKVKREELIYGLVTACLFENSDRARALCFMVIEINREKYKNEFETVLNSLKGTCNTLSEYKFSSSELDLKSTYNKIQALDKLLAGKDKQN